MFGRGGHCVSYHLQERVFETMLLLSLVVCGNRRIRPLYVCVCVCVCVYVLIIEITCCNISNILCIATRKTNDKKAFVLLDKDLIWL